MIVNPIYFNLGSNSSGNGENDWDPTDVKENKEMLDLTNFKPCTVVTGTYFTLFADKSSILVANNTTLILQLINNNDGYNQEIFMCGSSIIPSTEIDIIEGTQIKFYCLKSTNVFYKIKLPSVYNGHYIKFSGMSGRVNIYAWYKNN